MNQISLQELPPSFCEMADRINNEILKQLYANFSFNYISKEILNDKSAVSNSLLNYIQDCKFAAYHFSNLHHRINKNENKYFNSPSGERISYCIVCIEEKCFIIEQTDTDLIKTIFPGNQPISILYSHSNFSDSTQTPKKQDQYHIKEEINNFIDSFNEEVQNNYFIKLTIPSIACYIIRRHFYPKDYFKNQSFFNFGEPLNSNEMTIKLKLKKYLFQYEPFIQQNIISLILLRQDYKSLDFESIQQNSTQDFVEKDFIKLRKIYDNQNSFFYLVIHVKSFYIFMMKKIDKPDDISHATEHEISFCSNFKHRCFNRFYGFLKEKEKITGFIYKFLCNGSLSSYIGSNWNNSCNSLMIITRIIQGISYLHSNSLVYRDLKPTNILFDNDYIPYISDFETIRTLNQEQKDDVFTYDFGSFTYSSPEQDQGKPITYSTDIYSFGLLVYYIIKKKNLFSCNCNKKEIKLEELNCPLNIQNLIQNCIKYKPEERMEMDEIQKVICEEIDSLEYIVQCLLEDLPNINETLVLQYCFESMIINKKKGISLDDYRPIFLKFQQLYHFKVEQDDSSFYYHLGLLYYRKHECIKPSIIESIKYFSKAATLKNSDALVNLGNIYREGNEIEKDYAKAFEYYKKSAEMNNSLGVLFLGNCYRYGIAVEQDIQKAIMLYEKAVELNNYYAFIELGKIYFLGLGVQQNFQKALDYFTMSDEQNNLDASYFLAVIYEYGLGITKDHDKSLYYYNKIAQFGNSRALLNLGYKYLKGLGVAKDILRAREYFLRSSEMEENSEALYQLGNIYYNGIGIEQDYNLAEEFYKKSAELQNSEAYLALGNYYYNIKKNNKLAKDYYELAANHKNSEAYLALGYFYENAIGVIKDYIKAKKLYIKSAKLENMHALYRLGCLCINDDIFEKEIETAINYFKNCAQIESGIVFIYNCDNGVFMYQNKINSFRYHAFNDLGLIYLIELNDIENAGKNLKEAAFAEFPFGQNNFGLFNQIYLNDLNMAQHMYQRSLRHKFALAEYNLGYLKEKENNINESINLYSQASEHEDEPFIFRNMEFNDIRLKLSQTFIFRYVNLKLCEFYISEKNLEKAGQYFVKAFDKLKLTNDNSKYPFQFHYYFSTNSFDYLKNYILNFPDFNLKNQHSRMNSKESSAYNLILSSQNHEKNDSDGNSKLDNDQKNHNEIMFRYEFDSDDSTPKSNKSHSHNLVFKVSYDYKNDQTFQFCYKLKSHEEEINSDYNHNDSIQEKIIFEDPKSLFDFVINNIDQKVIKSFLDEVNDIIITMKNYLYTPPYQILFGRIFLDNSKHISSNTSSIDISDTFYDGLKND